MMLLPLQQCKWIRANANSQFYRLTLDVQYLRAEVMNTYCKAYRPYIKYHNIKPADHNYNNPAVLWCSVLVSKRLHTATTDCSKHQMVHTTNNMQCHEYKKIFTLSTSETEQQKCALYALHVVLDNLPIKVVHTIENGMSITFGINNPNEHLDPLHIHKMLIYTSYYVLDWYISLMKCRLVSDISISWQQHDIQSKMYVWLKT